MHGASRLGKEPALANTVPAHGVSHETIRAQGRA
jgi:hypothetical protein